MIYQVVSPFTTDIYGESYKDAIKHFVKLNRNLNISQMIIKDQTQHIEARMKYYQEDGRNKVGINMYPTNWNNANISLSIPFNQYQSQNQNRVSVQIPVSGSTLSPFAPIPMQVPLVDSLFSVSPTQFSPFPMNPFIPTVINVPNN